MEGVCTRESLSLVDELTLLILIQEEECWRRALKPA